MSTYGSVSCVRWSDKLLNIIPLMAIYHLGWLKCHPLF
nr:MAG TPA: hypothetical protein [Caudoviricetes sp.]